MDRPEPGFGLVLSDLIAEGADGGFAMFQQPACELRRQLVRPLGEHMGRELQRIGNGADVRSLQNFVEVGAQRNDVGSPQLGPQPAVIEQQVVLFRQATSFAQVPDKVLPEVRLIGGCGFQVGEAGAAMLQHLDQIGDLARKIAGLLAQGDPLGATQWRGLTAGQICKAR